MQTRGHIPAKRGPLLRVCRIAEKHSCSQRQKQNFARELGEVSHGSSVKKNAQAMKVLEGHANTHWFAYLSHPVTA